jgi:hypothetical protein
LRVKLIKFRDILPVVAYGLLSAGLSDKRLKNGHITIFLASPRYGRFTVKRRGASKAIRVAAIHRLSIGLKTSPKTRSETFVSQIILYPALFTSAKLNYFSPNPYPSHKPVKKY